MKNFTKRTWLMALALATLGLSACKQPGPAQEAGRKIDEVAEHAKTSTQAEIKQVDTAVSDADITAKVKLALMMRDGLNSLTISVKTQAGAVTLSGSVASAAQSQLAQELAQAVDDVTHVDNQLTIVSAAQPIHRANP